MFIVINAGSALCLNCGHLLSGSYYYNGKENCWVVLTRSIFGRYDIREYSSPKQTGSKDARFSKFTLSSKHRNSVKEMTDEIYVDITEADGSMLKERQFKRCCPYCGDNKPIFKEFGALPTYVIALIGGKSVGKSSWIKALTYLDNQIALNKFPYRIYPAKAGENFFVGIATGIGEGGSTSLFTIAKRASKESKPEPIVNVLVLDFAGEVFKDEEDAVREEFSRVRMLLSGTERYRGADALVFMDSPDHVYNPIKAFNSVNSLGVLQDRPVAFIINKVDLLLENPPTITLPVCNIKTPLFSEETFKVNFNSDVYSEENLVPRIRLGTYLVSQYSDVANWILSDNPHSAGFFIQTAKSEGNNTDLSTSINVMDPIIWLLNELGIFPITKEPKEALK